TWIADRKDDPDSSPGQVRHYYLDTSDCLGSEWDWDPVSKRLGYSYLLDYGDVSLDFISFGALARPWDRIQRAKGREMFGYFNVDAFDPEGWKNEYPNPAFSRMTERDGAWMARILAGFTPDDVAALAKLGRFSDVGNIAYLQRVLEGRLQRLLARYLGRLSPVTHARIEGDMLCGVDLAQKRGVRPPSAFHFSARTDRGGSLAASASDDGRVCVKLAHVAGAGGGGDSAARYFAVRIDDGFAKDPLVAYVYDLGDGGFRLAGLERP
ncbi:MAG TPA: hypothetical protein VH054_06310, partial [Polyangiaceae bacterium]|nr:hypothetical protein [Polyangiaceae bacterium]